MSPALTLTTTIPPSGANRDPNPLDTIIHNAGRKLCALQMTRLWGEADKSDAQSLTRDLLDIAKIVDDALLLIGREARFHFGSDVDLSLFAGSAFGRDRGQRDAHDLRRGRGTRGRDRGRNRRRRYALQDAPRLRGVNQSIPNS